MTIYILACIGAAAVAFCVAVAVYGVGCWWVDRRRRDVVRNRLEEWRRMER